MADDSVRLVKPGMRYEGAQVTYDAGVSRKTVGAEKVCITFYYACWCKV